MKGKQQLSKVWYRASKSSSSWGICSRNCRCSTSYAPQTSIAGLTGVKGHIRDSKVCMGTRESLPPPHGTGSTMGWPNPTSPSHVGKSVHLQRRKEKRHSVSGIRTGGNRREREGRRQS